MTCSADFAKNCAILVGSCFDGLAASSLREKIADFLVACLGKIFVPLADGVEAFRDHYRRYLIGFTLDLATG